MLWVSLLIFSIACTEAALHGNTGLPVCVINCDMWYQASAPTTSPTETVGPFPLCHIIFDIWGYLIPCLASTGEVSSCSIAILFPFSLMTEQIHLKIYSVCAFIFATLRVLLSISIVSLLFGFLFFQQNCSSYTEFLYLLPIVFARHLVFLVW